MIPEEGNGNKDQTGEGKWQEDARNRLRGQWRSRKDYGPQFLVLFLLTINKHLIILKNTLNTELLYPKWDDFRKKWEGEE